MNIGLHGHCNFAPTGLLEPTPNFMETKMFCSQGNCLVIAFLDEEGGIINVICRNCAFYTGTGIDFTIRIEG